MVTRALALLPELVLAVAMVPAFAAVLSGGAHAGRLARGAWVAGAAGALAAAVASIAVADDFFFSAYRVDAFSQLVKALVLVGALAAAMRSRADDGAWGDARATGPLLRLLAVSTFVAAASAADLLLLWVLFEVAAVAHLVTVATEGRWSLHEGQVRRLVATWLPTAVIFALGCVMAGAEAETTRFDELEGALPSPGGLLVFVAVLARAGLQPWQAAVALARGGEGAGVAVLSGASWWTLAVAVAIRVAALSGDAPAAWATPALIALAAVPAGIAALVVTGPALPARSRGRLVFAGLVGAAVFIGALAWAPLAGAALP